MSAAAERVQGLLVHNRREGDTAPREKRRRVFVDRNGRVVIGDDLPRGDEGQSLSEVHQAVFA
jgi:hypothetical protein